MHYFAYGVNLNLRKMREYCPGAIFLSPASILDHRLIFDGQSIRRHGATANIREETGQIVWGALFEIKKQELDELDEFEDYPTSYVRKQITVLTAEGSSVYPEVWVYYREGRDGGRPGAEYFDEILAGARMCDLPVRYITTLETVATL